MPMSEETKKILREKGRQDLIDIMEINDSGYAGVLSNGNIVDRREHPEAIPVPENKMMGIPPPKSIEWELCITCNGSGEGPADGTTCHTCKGQGELPPNHLYGYSFTP